MAIVMSILMLLSMGMVDFGMFLTGYIRATNCTREAARAAVVRRADAADVCTSDNLTPLYSGYTVAIAPSGYTTANSGEPVTVTINATYEWKVLAPVVNLFTPGSVFPATSPVTVRSTMRLEGQRP